MTLSRAGGLLAFVVGPLVSCALLGAFVGGDPMIAVEIGAAAMAATWALIVVRDLFRHRHVERDLFASARETVLFGVQCHVTHALGTDALVLGSLKPRIFVGEQLIKTLSDDELRAVVFHEDHHRRTRAPLRAAALGAWVHLLGSSRWVRSVVLDRLADLESMADADAMRRGSSARSLAGALMKGEYSLQPVAFSYAADRRVQRLLDSADGVPSNISDRAPYEWLPIAALAAVALACALGL